MNSLVNHCRLLSTSNTWFNLGHRATKNLINTCSNCPYRAIHVAYSSSMYHQLLCITQTYPQHHCTKVHNNLLYVSTRTLDLNSTLQTKVCISPPLYPHHRTI